MPRRAPGDTATRALVYSRATIKFIDLAGVSRQYADPSKWVYVQKNDIVEMRLKMNVLER